MLRSAVLAFLPLALLAACQPAPPSCTSPADRELRTVDRLIDETRATIDRGYTLERNVSPSVNVCLGGGSDTVGVSFCSDGGTRRVAIDPAAEGRKLDALLARRDELASQSAADHAACTGGAP